MTPEEVVAQVPRLESLPESYQRLQQVADHPHATAVDVAEALSLDQGLATRCLRLANSPLYGFPSRIDTVTRAVAVVGTRQICQLALAGSVMDLFKGLGVDGLRSLWRHGIACALTARHLGQLLRDPNSERLFIAGLLHDVGQMALLAAGGAPATAAATDGEGLEAERARWGCDHAQVGACLLRRWNLPEVLADAVSHHHGLPCLCHPLDCAVVASAEGVATALALDGCDSRQAEPVADDCWRLTGLKPEHLPALAEEVDRQFEEVALALGQGGSP